MAILLETRSDSKSAQEDLKKLRQSVENIQTSVDQTSKKFSDFAKITIAGVAAAISSGGLMRLSDELLNIRTKIQLVTDTQEQFNKSLKDVRAIAINTRSELSGVANLYSKVTRSSREFGASQVDVAKFTKLVSQAITISGGGVQESAAAIQQLSQGLASGRLAGDELRSVLENAPVLAEAIAKGLGTSIGNLRKMGEEGELTASKVFGAVLKRQSDIEKQFGRVNVTFGSSILNLKTSLSILFDEVKTTILGSSNFFTNFINSLALKIFDFATNFRIIFIKLKLELKSLALSVLIFFSQFQKPSDEILNIFEKISNYISQNWKPTLIAVFTIIGSIASSTANIISDAFINLFNNLKNFNINFDFIYKLKESITSLLKQSLDFINNIYNRIPKIDLKNYFLNFDNVLNTIENWAQQAEKWFFWLYDKVVGNSWIPDLVKDVTAWLSKLMATPLTIVKDFTSKVNIQFAGLKFNAPILVATTALLKYKNILLGTVAIMTSLVGLFKLLSFTDKKGLTNLQIESNVNLIGEKLQKDSNSILKRISDNTRKAVFDNPISKAFKQLIGVDRPAANTPIDNRSFFDKLPDTSKFNIITVLTGILTIALTRAVESSQGKTIMFGLATTVGMIAAARTVSPETITEQLTKWLFNLLNIIEKGISAIFFGNVIKDPVGLVTLVAKLSLLFQAGREYFLTAARGAITAPTTIAQAAVSRVQLGIINRSVQRMTVASQTLAATSRTATAQNRTLFRNLIQSLVGQRDQSGAIISRSAAVQAVRSRNENFFGTQATSNILNQINQLRAQEVTRRQQVEVTQRDFNARIAETTRRSQVLAKALNEQSNAFRQGVVNVGAGIGGIVGGVAGFQIGIEIARGMENAPSWKKIGVVLAASLGIQAIGAGIGSAIAFALLGSMSLIGAAFVSAITLGFSAIFSGVAFLSALTSPFIVGAALIGGALYLAYKAWEDLPNSWKDKFRELGTTFINTVKDEVWKWNLFGFRGTSEAMGMRDVNSPAFQEKNRQELEKLRKELETTRQNQASARSDIKASYDNRIKYLEERIKEIENPATITKEEFKAELAKRSRENAFFGARNNLPPGAVPPIISPEESSKPPEIAPRTIIPPIAPSPVPIENESINKIIKDLQELGIAINKVTAQRNLGLEYLVETDKQLKSGSLSKTQIEEFESYSKVFSKTVVDSQILLNELEKKVENLIKSFELTRNPIQKASGGFIKGPGTGTSDSIPAMLSDGEFVVNAKDAKKNWDILTAINSGVRVNKFKDGTALNQSVVVSGPLSNKIKYPPKEISNARLHINSIISQFPQIRIEETNNLPFAAHGTYQPFTGELKVIKDASEPVKYETYLHELGHADQFINKLKIIPNTILTKGKEKLFAIINSIFSRENGFNKNLLFDFESYANTYAAVNQKHFLNDPEILSQRQSYQQHLILQNFEVVAKNLEKYKNALDISDDGKLNNSVSKIYIENLEKYSKNDENKSIYDSLLNSLQKIVFINPLKKASGGWIRGPGSATSDSIPAMLSNGEFVINSKATSKYKNILEQINDGTFDQNQSVAEIEKALFNIFKEDKQLFKDRFANVLSKKYELPKDPIRRLYAAEYYNTSRLLNDKDLKTNILTTFGILPDFYNELKEDKKAAVDSFYSKVKNEMFKDITKLTISNVLVSAGVGAFSKGLFGKNIGVLISSLLAIDQLALPVLLGTLRGKRYFDNYGDLSPKNDYDSILKNIEELPVGVSLEYVKKIADNLESSKIGSLSNLETVLKETPDIKSQTEKAQKERLKKIKEQFGFATGGFVTGPGTGTSYSIPAMLSNGEFVVNAKDASKNWDILTAINSGYNVSKFKDGTKKTNRKDFSELREPGLASESFIETLNDSVKNIDLEYLQKLQYYKEKKLQYETSLDSSIGFFDFSIPKITAPYPIGAALKRLKPDAKLSKDFAIFSYATTLHEQGHAWSLGNKLQELLDSEKQSKMSVLIDAWRSAHLLRGKLNRASIYGRANIVIPEEKIASDFANSKSILKGKDQVKFKDYLLTLFKTYTDYFKYNIRDVLQKDFMRHTINKDSKGKTLDWFEGDPKLILNEIQKDYSGSLKIFEKYLQELPLQEVSKLVKVADASKYQMKLLPSEKDSLYDRTDDIQSSSFAKYILDSLIGNLKTEIAPIRVNKASGGWIKGPGTATSDSIPAMLSNGEFVVNAKDAQKNWDILTAINSGYDVRYFKDGSEDFGPGDRPSSFGDKFKEAFSEFFEDILKFFKDKFPDIAKKIESNLLPKENTDKKSFAENLKGLSTESAGKEIAKQLKAAGFSNIDVKKILESSGKELENLIFFVDKFEKSTRDIADLIAKFGSGSLAVKLARDIQVESASELSKILRQMNVQFEGGPAIAGAKSEIEPNKVGELLNLIQKSFPELNITEDIFKILDNKLRKDLINAAKQVETRQKELAEKTVQLPANASEAVLDNLTKSFKDLDNFVQQQQSSFKSDIDKYKTPFEVIRPILQEIGVDISENLFNVLNESDKEILRLLIASAADLKREIKLPGLSNEYRKDLSIAFQKVNQQIQDFINVDSKNGLERMSAKLSKMGLSFDTTKLVVLDNVERALVNKLSKEYDSIDLSKGDFEEVAKKQLRKNKIAESIRSVIENSTASEMIRVGNNFAASVQANISSAFSGLLKGEYETDKSIWITFRDRILNSTTSEIISAFSKGFTRKLFGGSETFEKLGESLFEFGSTIFTYLKDALSNPSEIAELFTNFTGLVSDLGGLLMKGLKKIFDSDLNLGDIFKNIFDGVKMFFTVIKGFAGYASGGYVSGPGTATSDSIPAMLSNGEFVINAAATRNNLALLNAINTGKLSTFETGGFVSSSLAQTPTIATFDSIPEKSKNTSQIFNINITGDISRQTKSEIYKMLPSIADGVNYYNREKGVVR